ncbi:hypothetical protein [Streptomyces sp. NPDC006012]|uniref:hypothetical protein n=1 Tax=Streptomyces sp. NPDC006012 TaxID=3364739 RepID=UPI0036A2DFC5
MSPALVAVALSLVSAVAYAAAAVAQERLAARNSGTGLLRLLGKGAWWTSVGLNGGAAALHVVALTYGPLTVVQPLGALTLVAAVPMGARFAGRRVSAVEWRGTALTLLGLAALLVTASGPAPERVLTLTEALAVAGTTAALIGVLARPGTRPGLRHATASGFASGVASALTQTVTVAATDRTGPALSPTVIVVALLVAAFASGGLLLSQTAYRDGLGAPLALVTLTNPVAASVLGLTLLGQGLQGGAEGVLLALAGAAAASWGVVLLTRVPRPAPRPAGAGPTAAMPALESRIALTAPARVLEPGIAPAAPADARKPRTAPTEPKPALEPRSALARPTPALEPRAAPGTPTPALKSRISPAEAAPALKPHTNPAAPAQAPRRPDPGHLTSL